MKRLALIMAVVAVVFAAAGPAYGQSAVGDAYGGRGGGILGAVSNGGGGGGTSGGQASTPAPVQVQAAATESGSLPFTGLDLGLLALGGVVLVGVGVGLRRFARPLS